MADVQSLNFSWLLKLRWGAIAAQLLVFFSGDRLVHVSLPLFPLLLIIAVEAVTNIAGMLWVRRATSVPEGMLAALMTLDCFLLTAMLYLTGGDSNPFAVLYLVNIALAGMLLKPKWTWTITAISLTCFGLLFATKSEIRTASASDPMEWQLREMWLSFAVASALIVYFVQRTKRMLRERERAAEATRQAAERREKLASLATLAAGAAHELATPLSTIALVAKELERQLEAERALRSIDDARLIRNEVERCRTILSRMAADAGGNAGEPLEPLPVDALVAKALADVPERQRVDVKLDAAAANEDWAVPPRAFVHAVQAVLKNAVQASPENSRISVRIKADGLNWRLEIEDQGPGMNSQVLARAGEPFFTTKEPGRGMGLGLFLTRSLLEQLGGRLELQSGPRRGTLAALVLPKHPPLPTSSAG